MLHTERNILIRERTACANSMRAILAEFGIIMPRTLSQLYKKIPEILEEYDNEYHLLSVVVSRVNLNTFRVWKIKSR
ncbi:putative transposase for [Yersinia enterocolitica]|nr:putative transposase for [Yersinia enterocolitica]